MREFYRFTYNNKGIYNELKKIVGKDTWLYLLTLEEFTWLPKPSTYSSENKSYFTKKGFTKFKEETLPIMLKYLELQNIKIKLFSKVENIIYSNKYQVIEIL